MKYFHFVAQLLFSSSLTCDIFALICFYWFNKIASEAAVKSDYEMVVDLLLLKEKDKKISHGIWARPDASLKVFYTVDPNLFDIACSKCWIEHKPISWFSDVSLVNHNVREPLSCEYLRNNHMVCILTRE